MNNKKFYLREKGQRTGPFTVEELHDRGITGDTKVWAQGMDGWTKASDVPELYELIAGLPPASKNPSLAIAGIVILTLIIAGLVWGNSLFTEKKKVIVQAKIYNNQELYTNFSPSVVLVEHKYYYQISAGGKKYFFNSIYGTDAFTYLDGLTEDQSLVGSQTEPIQGTGFFISNDGKILTNRHVIPGDPTGAEELNIEKAFVKQLSISVDRKKELDSIRYLREYYDMAMLPLFRDSVANAAKIAELKEKIAAMDEVLSVSGSDINDLKLDDSALNVIATGPIEIKKITQQLEIFMPGSMEIEEGKGTKCKLISVSSDPELDLAMIQTTDKQLPILNLKLADLSRIKKIKDAADRPHMSEKLIMIGYNQGTLLSNTSEGIKPQLTEGKISQNTDSYKLMYTIPALPGSSGSPILDDKGQVVSVNFAGISDTQNFNYGIQPARVREFLKSNNIF